MKQLNCIGQKSHLNGVTEKMDSLITSEETLQNNINKHCLNVLLKHITTVGKQLINDNIS